MTKYVLQLCVVIALATVLLPAGCARKSRCNPDGTPSAESFAAHGRKPGEEEAKLFALKLEKAVAAGNLAEANALVHWDTLFDFATDTAEGSSQFRDGFIKRLKEKIQAPGSLMGQTTSMVAQGGGYKFLRCRDQDGQLHVLFRLMPPQGGINYHDFVVLKYPDGVRAAEIYLATQGELTSQLMRRVYFLELAADKPGFLSKENDRDADLVKSSGKLQEMADAMRQKDPRHVIAVYDTLPQSIKGDKVVLMLRLMAAQSLNDDSEHGKVLDDFESTIPKIHAST